tara:strand:- start:2058 stop:2261 length:204 start_codon:yes stop_codon:yes gene_type:complete
MITEALIEKVSANMDSLTNQVETRRNGEDYLDWRLTQEALCGKEAVQEYLDRLTKDRNGLTIMPLSS